MEQGSAAVIHIGFTGTRNGMTDRQLAMVLLIVRDQVRMPSGVRDLTAHHGDCLGADAQFHRIARDVPGSWLVGHIPAIDVDRAFCAFDEVRDPLPYMRRNREIVRAAHLMIAAPPTLEELQHGGTWRTIGLARKANVPLAIVRLDGTVTWENT